MIKYLSVSQDFVFALVVSNKRYPYNPKLTLKNVTNVWDVDQPQMRSAKNVVTPPLSTAGPITSRLLRVFCSREPINQRNLVFTKLIVVQFVLCNLRL